MHNDVYKSELRGIKYASVRVIDMTKTVKTLMHAKRSDPDVKSEIDKGLDSIEKVAEEINRLAYTLEKHLFMTVDIFPNDDNFEPFTASMLTGRAEFFGVKRINIRTFEDDGSYTEEPGVMFKLNNMMFVASRIVYGGGCFVYCKGLEVPDELTGREADVLGVSGLSGERDMLHLVNLSRGEPILDVGIVTDDLGFNKFVYHDYINEKG